MICDVEFCPANRVYSNLPITSVSTWQITKHLSFPSRLIEKKKQKDATMRTLERKRQLEEFHRGWPFFISVSLVVTTCPAVARNNHIQQYRAIFLPARLAPKLIGTNVRVTLLIPYIPQTRGKHEDYWSPLKNGSTVAVSTVKFLVLDWFYRVAL